MERGRPPRVIFQLDMVNNFPMILLQNMLNEKLFLFFFQACSKSSKHNKNGALSVSWLK
jgi:hypothetical protein